MDKSFQDVQLYTSYRCTGGCKSGILLRAQKTPDGGMTGVYVSLTEGDTTAYAVTIDPAGKELTREPLAAPAGRGGGGGRRGTRRQHQLRAALRPARRPGAPPLRRLQRRRHHRPLEDKVPGRNGPRDAAGNTGGFVRPPPAGVEAG